MSTSTRAASAFSTDQLQSLTTALLTPTGASGVYVRTGLFEQVIDGLSTAISALRAPAAEVLRFPPVMSRAVVEKSGYHTNFPHLLGCVCSMHGSEAEIRALVSGEAEDKQWTDALRATDLVLTPAACYPVYPFVASRGSVPAKGHVVDVASYCFRREATHELGRLQSFRMREFVCLGEPEAVQAFRQSGLESAERLVQQLELPYRIDRASDPFFGRVGKLMAVSQIEQALKLEMLIPMSAEQPPVACMSFNYHQHHFGTTWDIDTDAGEAAHSACVAFGIDRLGLALFATHGLDMQKWPGSARETLSL